MTKSARIGTECRNSAGIPPEYPAKHVDEHRVDDVVIDVLTLEWYYIIMHYVRRTDVKEKL